MSIILCPECGHSVSDKATKCPECGYPIQEHINNENESVDSQDENLTPSSLIVESLPNIQQPLTQKRNRKKLFVCLISICVVIIAALGTAFGLGLFAPKLKVENIYIEKWRLTDESSYGGYYEGTVTSEQKKPFIAVIGQYDNKESTPELVYMENGKGVFETYEGSDEDPSIKYRAIGFMGGKPVKSSDVKVLYTDSDYSDYSYSQTSSCDVLINIEMNNSKNGFLVFDVVNETHNEEKRNMIAIVINGKAECEYYADLPYKARGIDVSIVPKLFCESSNITEEDYLIEKEYKAEKYEGKYFNSYSGEETLAFSDYTDGYVLYTEELKDGGDKEDRNIVNNLSVLLTDGECTLSTYTSVDADKNILMPKYEFDIIGVITWTKLKMEAKE